jgi:hypothetical protein
MITITTLIKNKIGTCFDLFYGMMGSEEAPSISYPEPGKPKAMSTVEPDQTLEYNDVFKYLHKEVRKQYKQNKL